MGRIVVSEFVTVDGVMEDPGGAEAFEHGGWAFKFDRGDEGDRFKLEELMDADAMLLGRTTYEGFARAWPGRTDDVGFAERMNGMPKYVVSRTLREPEWNNTAVITGELADEVLKLKQRFDRDILVAGSARLVNGLRRHGLVDEYRLMVFPVVLGRGKRLFDDVDATTSLRVTGTKTAGECLIVTYASAPEGGDG
jgi:dihydrofolate reductase